MTPARWARAGELFHAALDVPAEQRREWVDSACAGDPAMLEEVLSLLGSDAMAGEGFVSQHVDPAFAALAQAKEPERVGPYRLLREIGRGGMGTVYLAERDDEQYQAQAAIKLVRRGMDTGLVLSRFYRERQTLARLQHPHIARLLDGGTTGDGYPYIVMEFVNGDKITEYCSSHGLTIAQRLELFLDVCEAVDYAHRQFVVHRDLKPGNILVDQSGQVKLLDFGICKLLQTQPVAGAETVEMGPAPLTPDYASPEQIRGEPVTIVSDVYSAAAVLYELLTGRRPHQIEEYSLRGIEKGICETEILRPSEACANASISRQLRGDIDNILLFALQKDPRRRYESMSQFADDIRRHLDHLPVRARPDTLAYRTGKFLRRRHTLVLSGAAIVLALTTGAFVSMRSAKIANENLKLVRQLSNTFVFDVYDAVKNLPGSTQARQLIVQTGLEYLDRLSRNASGDMQLQLELAAAYRRVGDVQGNVMQANLGNTTAAMASYEKAIALLEQVLTKDPQHPTALGETLTLYRGLGAILEYTSDLNQAVAAYGKAEAMVERLLKRLPGDAGVRQHMASIYLGSARARLRRGDLSIARQNYMRALDLLDGLAKTQPQNVMLQGSLATAWSGIGLCDARLGKLDEALRSHKKAAAVRERLVQLDAANVHHQRELMLSYAHIGDLRGNPNVPNLGDRAGAAEAYGRMREVARTLHEADPEDQRARSDYGIALSRVSALLPDQQANQKIEILRQALALQDEVRRVNPKNLSNSGEMAANYNFLGDAYLLTGQDSNAIHAYRAGISIAEASLGSGASVVATTCVLLYQKLGELLVRKGERAEALALAGKALALTDPAGPAAQKRSETLRKFFAAKGFSVMGKVYAASPRATDRTEARKWLEKGLKAYLALEGDPRFSSAHRREMQEIKKLLEAGK